MQISVLPYADTNIQVVAPTGRIDQASADEFLSFMQSLLNQSAPATLALVLDFSGVDYIASVGLRALMVTARQCKSLSGRIAIAALQPMVQEVFSIARFDLVIACFDSVESAARELSVCK